LNDEYKIIKNKTLTIKEI